MTLPVHLDENGHWPGCRNFGCVAARCAWTRFVVSGELPEAGQKPRHDSGWDANGSPVEAP